MRKKKLLVLSSYGGYGHIAATNTLKKLLERDYEICVAYPIKELRILKLPAGESFYNWLLSNSLNSLTNWIVKWIPHRLFSRRTEKSIQLIRRYIEDHQVDLLISVIPFINYPAAEAARVSDIPFLLITTDNDLKNWVYDLEKMKKIPFKVTVGSNLPTTSGRLLDKGVAPSAIEEVGLPLRPEFYESWSKKALREKYKIAEEKNVVLIMMGGAGSKATIKYVKALIACSMNLHVIVCAGRNEHLSKKLKNLAPAIGNVIDVIPFTEKVHELLVLSDLLITKPGPGTINEAYALKLPILLDRTQPPLFWEKANIDLVLRNGVGACIESFQDAPAFVARFLLNEQVKESVDRAYAEMEDNQFAKSIQPLIEEMIQGELVIAGQNISTFS